MLFFYHKHKIPFFVRTLDLVPFHLQHFQPTSRPSFSFLLFFSFLPHLEACGILVPPLRKEPGSLQWKH